MADLYRLRRSPSRLHLSLHAAAAGFACGHPLLRCWARWPARSAPNTASSFWSIRCRSGAGAAALDGVCDSWRSLIAADNLLWRVASWIANYAFVGVTGDLRRDLFRHLTGPFAELFRRSAARHADEPRHRDLERGLHGRKHVRLERAAALRRDGRGDRARLHDQPADGRRAGAVAGIMVLVMFRLAAAGRPLHHDFASKAAAVDGEMVDVDQQYAAGARLRRLSARAPPLRRHRRSRDGRAAAQPALSREAAHLPRRRDRSS